MAAIQRLLETHGGLDVQERDWDKIVKAGTPHIFQMDDYCGFVALDEKGRPALGNADNMPAAAAWLDAHDEFLTGLEACLSLSMDPAALVDAAQSAFADDELVSLQINGLGGGILLLVKDGHPLMPRWVAQADALPVDPESHPVSVEMVLDMPALPEMEVANLGVGDLILLAPATPTILNVTEDAAQGLQQQYWPDACLTGMLDVGSGNLNPDPNIASQMKPALKLRVATQIAAATLGRMLPGGPPQRIAPAHGSAALLSMGDELLASGELVTLAHGLAFEVGQLVAQDSAPPPAPETQTQTEMES